MLVLDASAAVDLVLRRERRGAWVAEQLLAGGALHSPHLIDVEVASALRRFEAAGAAGGRMRQALDTFLGFPIVRHAPRMLSDRIWALRGALTAYDATYVALAEALDAPLLTTDDRLARATGHRAEIRAFV